MGYTKYIFNQKWSCGTGSQEELIKQKQITQTLIKCVYKERHYWSLIQNDKLINFIKTNNAFICEILCSYPMKVYFDIDGTDTSKVDLKHIKKIIRSLFDNANLSISGYETTNKKSYHIVVNNYVIENINDLHELKNMVSYINTNICSAFDSAVYTKNRAMKTIYQSKSQAESQQIIKDKDEFNHIIQWVKGDENKFKMNNIKEYDDIINIKKSFIELNALPMPEYDDIQLNDAKILLMMMPPKCHSNITYRCILFCITNGLSFHDFWEWSKQKEDTPKRYNNKLYQFNKVSDNYKLNNSSSIDINDFKKLLSLYYHEFKSTENKQLLALTDKFIKSVEAIRNEGEKIKMITIDHFNTPEKCIIFNLMMGGGKTTMTVSYLKQTGLKFIWITPRRALVSNTMQRFTQNNLIVTNYMDCGSANQKYKKINDATNIIIGCESLHYINDVSKFDVIIIDEIESVMKNWNSTTHKKNVSNNFNNFKNLFIASKKIILLDAYTSQTTTNFIKNLGDIDVKIYNSIDSPREKHIIPQNGYTTTVDKIIDDLNANKKLFIFYCFKNEGKKHISIEMFKNELETKTNKKIRLYHGDVADKVKKTLFNVNEDWDNFDAILTTSAITVGVNYEGINFNSIYIFGAGSVSNVRDIIQTSMRIRNTIETDINLYLFDKLNKKIEEYPNYYHTCNDNLYKMIVDDIITEHQSDFYETLKYFCKITNYNTDLLKEKLKDKSKEFKNELFNSKILMAYEDIDTYDCERVIEDIEKEQIFAQKATTHDKFIITKYYYDKKYYWMNIEDKKFVWNMNLQSYFENINSPFIQMIFDNNNVKQLSKIVIDKIIMKPSTKEYINKNFSAYALTDKSIKCKLTKLINFKLGFTAINTSYSKKSNTITYSYSDDLNEVEEINLNNPKTQSI